MDSFERFEEDFTPVDMEDTSFSDVLEGMSIDELNEAKAALEELRDSDDTPPDVPTLSLRM